MNRVTGAMMRKVQCESSRMSLFQILSICEIEEFVNFNKNNTKYCGNFNTDQCCKNILVFQILKIQMSLSVMFIQDKGDCVSPQFPFH